MPATILIVEGDEAEARNLLAWLSSEGMQGYACPDAAEAELCLKETRIDLAVISWTLSEKSGIELCRNLQGAPDPHKPPVILVGDRTDEEARIRALSTGADDYLARPVSPRELVARINAILRRTSPGVLSDVLRLNGIELNSVTHRVLRDGAEIRLGPTEFRLLEFLMRNPGRVYERDRLLDEVWGRETYVDDRTVDVHISRLRRIINGTHGEDMIRTVRGVGYSFEKV
jgi:two-component system phosphate regulon response regulator PhoB